MFNIWNDGHASLNFFNVPATEVINIEHTDLKKYNDSQIGIYRSDHWFFDISENALAITQYFAIKRNAGSSSEYLELLHADIIVNYRYYNFSKDKNSTNEYHLPSVILHELGHLLGLSHQNNYDIPAVMAPYMSVIDSFETLDPNDFKRIKNKYDDNSFIPSDDNGILLGATTSGESQSENVVRGIIELKKNGKCEHYRVMPN